MLRQNHAIELGRLRKGLRCRKMGKWDDKNSRNSLYVNIFFSVVTILFTTPHERLVPNGDPEIPIPPAGDNFFSSAPDGPTGTRRSRNRLPFFA
jgi:hypothetical protein